MKKESTEVLGTEIPKDDIQEKINEIATTTVTLKSGLQSFKEREAELKELAKEADGLEITSIEDKVAIEKVSTVRKKLKKARVEIEKQGKALRDPLTKFNKFISSKEAELLTIITPIEDSLQEKEDWVEKEYARIAKEEEDKKQAKFQERLNRLKEYGQTVEEQNREAIAVMTDEGFEGLVKYAKEAWEKEQKEKKDAEEKERKDREELEKLRKEKVKILEARKKLRVGQLTALGYRFNGDSYGNYLYNSFGSLNITEEAVETMEEEDWESYIADSTSKLESWKEAKQREEENKRRVDARGLELRGLGFNYVPWQQHYQYETIIIQNDFIEKEPEQGWKAKMEVVAEGIELLKKNAEEKRKAEIEEAQKKEAERVLGKSRYQILEGLKITKHLPTELGVMDEENWNYLHNKYKKVYNDLQKQEWEKQQQEKKQREEEELANQKDAEKIQRVVQQIRSLAAQLPEMKSKKNQKMMGETKVKLENIALDITSTISKSTNGQKAVA